MANRADVRDADEWWATLSDDRRVSTYRWLTGKSKTPPPTQDEALIDVDGNIAEEALAPGAEE